MSRDVTSQEGYLLQKPLEGAEEPKHGKWCRWPNGTPCREFSTDGTLLGAEIAHSMGTTSEEAITRRESRGQPFVSDVEAEQADWEEGE